MFGGPTIEQLVVEKYVHSTNSNYAPINDPHFTGIPTAPTAPTTDDSTQLATTDFVHNLVEGVTGVNLADYALLASPAFTGNPTFADYPLLEDVTDWGTLATYGHIKAQNYAPISNPVFKGNPTLSSTESTLSLTDNSLKLATTYYVQHQTFIKQAGFDITSTTIPQAPTPSNTVHLNDNSIATTAYINNLGLARKVSNNTFTGTNTFNGEVDFTAATTALTPSVNDNSTNLATTAYVIGQGYAKLASPSFTGTPLTVTPAITPVLSNSTQIANTIWVNSVLANYAPKVSAVLTTPTLNVNPASSDDSTAIASTHFVKNQGYISGGSPAFTGNPSRTTDLSLADTSNNLATCKFVTGQGYADLASPVFTGIPTTPTISDGTANPLQIANYTFVKNYMTSNGLTTVSPNFTGTPTTVTPTNTTIDTGSNPGTMIINKQYVANYYALKSGATLSSTTFSTIPICTASYTGVTTGNKIPTMDWVNAKFVNAALTGVSTAVNPTSTSTSSTQIATTYWVQKVLKDGYSNSSIIGGMNPSIWWVAGDTYERVTGVLIDNNGISLSTNVNGIKYWWMNDKLITTAMTNENSYSSGGTNTTTPYTNKNGLIRIILDGSSQLTATTNQVASAIAGDTTATTQITPITTFAWKKSFTVSMVICSSSNYSALMATNVDGQLFNMVVSTAGTDTWASKVSHSLYFDATYRSLSTAYSPPGDSVNTYGMTDNSIGLGYAAYHNANVFVLTWVMDNGHEFMYLDGVLQEHLQRSSFYWTSSGGLPQVSFTPCTYEWFNRTAAVQRYLWGVGIAASMIFDYALNSTQVASLTVDALTT